MFWAIMVLPRPLVPTRIRLRASGRKSNVSARSMTSRSISVGQDTRGIPHRIRCCRAYDPQRHGERKKGEGDKRGIDIGVARGKGGAAHSMRGWWDARRQRAIFDGVTI